MLLSFWPELSIRAVTHSTCCGATWALDVPGEDGCSWYNSPVKLQVCHECED